MIRCRLCNLEFGVISNTHLATAHKGWSLQRYIKYFGHKGGGFALSINQLPSSDIRYKRWRLSLKKRPPPWNTGHTKYTHPSVLKISRTMRARRIDNFAKWRIKMVKLGKLRQDYPALAKSSKTATLIGLVLGDGHIQRLPRTESLVISLNTKYPELVNFTRNLIEEVFDKEPHVYKVKSANMARVRLYQKFISKRLCVPPGNRARAIIKIPDWIWSSNKNLIAYLRGLFEAEGSLSIHIPTCTYNFAFSNKNPSLLHNVRRALEQLGFNPEVRPTAIRLRRKKEVGRFKNLISFRKYNTV